MVPGALAADKRKFVKQHAFSRMRHTVQFAFREVQARLRFEYQALGLAAAVAVLAYLGPFDTWGGLELPDRVAFWSLAIALNWIFGLIVGLGAVQAFERRGMVAWAVVVAGGSAVASIPGTAVVWLLVVAFMDSQTAGAAGITSLYSQVIAIHLVLTSLITWLIVGPPRHVKQEDTPFPTQPVATPDNAFLKRVPTRLGRNLLHLHMQDHYLEVHTDRGSDLLLIRFRDALREVADLDGAQVHRSHWVARAALDRIARRNGRVVLHLVNGSEVPVSRSFASDLRDKGWF